MFFTYVIVCKKKKIELLRENFAGTVDQQGNINKVTSIGAAQVAQQQPHQQQTVHHQAVQQTQPQQTVQQVSTVFAHLMELYHPSQDMIYIILY